LSCPAFRAVYMPASQRTSQGGEQPTLLSTQQTQQKKNKQNGNSNSDNWQFHDGFFSNIWTGQHRSYCGPGVPPNHECILQHHLDTSPNPGRWILLPRLTHLTPNTNLYSHDFISFSRYNS